MTNFGMMVSSLKQNIARAVVGKDDVVELMLTALLCEGHVLIEDVPGVGKTTLAARWRVRSPARSSAFSSRRTSPRRISRASPCPACPAKCSIIPAQS